MRIDTEKYYPLITLFFLTKTIAVICGIILYVSNLYWPSYLSILFNDITFYNMSIMIPIILIISYGLITIGLREKNQIAYVLSIIFLIIDLFTFPIGTIIAGTIILVLLSKQIRETITPFKKEHQTYRIIGILLFTVTMGLFLSSTGIASSLFETFSTPSLSIMSPSEKIEEVIEATNYRGDTYIVELTGSTTQAIQQQQILTTYIQGLDGEIIETSTDIYNGMLVRISESQLMDLAENQNVAHVYPNIIIPLLEETINYDVVYNLDNTADIINAKNVNRTGRGITVAVVDTGINGNIQQLQRNGESIVVDSFELYGDYVHYHGTAIACCVASQHETYKGIAPDVDLLDVEVFFGDEDGVGATIWDIIKGWEWVAQYKQSTGDYVICTNSFGSPYGNTGCGGWSNPCPLCASANKMVEAYDIPMIIASGNRHNTYGLRLHCPGTAEKAITVGAITDNGVITSFSCTGPTPDGNRKPDVVAPGLNIDTFDSDGRRIQVSGTSLSTPITAGALALIAEDNLLYTSDQFKKALQTSATDKGTPGYDYSYGYGIVNVENALNNLHGGNPIAYLNVIMFSLMISGVGIMFTPEIKKWYQ